MELFAGLSVVILVLTALVIATKTYLLWYRTRGLPELLLALYLTCATVTGYPLAIAMSQIPPSENWLIHVAAEVVMGLGWVWLLLFTLNVFRPGALWAWCVVSVALLFVVLAGVGYVIEVTAENPRNFEELTLLIALNAIPSAIAYFWTTIEAFVCHRRLKMQLRLGLTNVVVVNRVLLWGTMALAAGVALVISIGAMLAGYYLSPAVILVSSVLGVVHAGCLFFAFHPPVWYKGWLERQASMEGA